MVSLAKRIDDKIAKARQLAAEWAPARAQKLALSGGVVSITIDDFPKSAWVEGGPLFAAYGVKATYYVCGGHEGGMFEGVRQFDREDIVAAAAAGHDIACHTYDHVSPYRSSPAEFEASLSRNAAWLADRLGADHPGREHFAYPFGHVSFASKAACAGRFTTARGVAKGLNAGTVDLAQLKAYGYERYRLSTFPLAEMMRTCAERRGWLIFYTHEISDDANAYGCTPRDMAALIEAAAKAGLEVAPVSAVVSRLAPPVTVAAE
jgi:peptidoglycan/xylan/chitin deacetylase (PgdA/CDA1 family)